MKDKDFDDSAYAMDADGNKNIEEMSKRKKLAIGVLAVVLICALGLLAPALLAFIDPQAGGDGRRETAAGTNTGASLSIEMPVSRYTALLSSVPGLPFRAVCPAANEIRFTTGAGTFLSWGAPDYKVQQQSAAYTCAPGDTAYLAPAIDENSSVEQRTVTAFAYAYGQEIGRAVIIISHEDGYTSVQNISVAFYS